MDQNRTSMREVNLRQSHKATHSSNEKDPAIISDHSWLG